MDPSKCGKAQTTERSTAFILNWDFKPDPEPKYIIVNNDPQPVQTSTANRTQFIPSAFETPVNFWDEWRAREGIVERHLTLKSRSS